MPQQTRIFRVFVSSTFTDMKEERGILQKKVFPKLEKFCEENGARFQAVDLRWGVNEESQLNQKTLDICLNEIARCQRISPKPNFLILMGDKYGWQPLPTRIPESEMDAIHSKTKEHLPLLNEWYKPDINAIPPEYVLQPRGKDFEEYAKWENVENALKNIIRNAVSQLPFSQEQQIKYMASATHQEIMAGALATKGVKERPEDHVFAFIRETEGLPGDASANGFIDLKDGRQDPFCKEQLTNLKQKLSDKLGGNCISYPAKWDNGKTLMADPDGFETKIYKFLESIIKGQIGEVISPDEIEHEVKLHQEFKTRLTEFFCGREEVLGRISNYLTNQSETRPMVLIGDSGSGKSSVMAMALQAAENSGNPSVIAGRFIGTTSSSSNIVNLLQSVSGQVAREFGTTLEAIAGEGREKSLYDINGITEVFRKCLGLATPEKQVIVFLDALDQLSDADNARSLYWMPRELPENARLVVSALPGLEGTLAGNCMEHLPVLPLAEANQIMDKWFLSVNRKLTHEQQNELIHKFSLTGLPIYLKLAFEQAKHWHSYTTDFQLPPDVSGIIDQLMERFEHEHTRDLVEHVIGYMLCGRYQGLAENEILEILVFDKEFWEGRFLPHTHPEHRSELMDVTKIPIVVWSRLYLDLEPFLTERDADGVPIITFFHRQFVEVLQKRYQLD